MNRNNKTTKKILSITTTRSSIKGLGSRKVRQILWCYVESETSRSIKTSTIYHLTQGFGVSDSKMYSLRKPVNLNKKNPLKKLNEIAEAHHRTQSFIEYISSRRDSGPCFVTKALSKNAGGKRLSGRVLWFSGGSGSVETDFGALFFYSCNFKKADSSFPQLVSNIELEKGQTITFEISKDPFSFSHCGLGKLEIPSIPKQKAV